MAIEIAKKAIKVAKTQQNYHVQIKALNLIAGSFLTQKMPDSAKWYAEKAISLADLTKMDSLKGSSFMTLGTVSYKAQAYNAAIEKYREAIAYYRLNNKELSVAASFLNIGMCNDQLSQYREAITCYLTACKTFEYLKDSSYLAYSLNSAALCFVSLKDYSKAIAYNKKTLSIRKNLHNNRLVAESFNNLGFTFEEYGQVDSAIHYLSKSIRIYNNEPDSSLLILPLQNMGSAVKSKGDLKAAEKYFDRSLSIASKFDMPQEIAAGNLDKAELLLKQKKYQAALKCADITEEIALKVNFPEILMKVYTFKASLFTQTGQDKQALLYTNKKDLIKDSIFTAAKNTAITELDVKYQTSQKERDIATLNTTNTLQAKVVKQQTISIIVLIVASVLMLVLLGIAYHNFRLKNRANQRIQTLMRDMHHRVKNNLMILSGLFSMQINEFHDEKTKNTLRENESRLISMNLIHNKLYQDNTTTKIEMQDYLIKLLHHIQDSFGGYHIGLDIAIDPMELEADKAVAIGLIVNELTTNAFKYAFEDEHAGKIFLALKHKGKSRLLLSVGDNGKGISSVHKENGASFGLKLVNLMARQLHSELLVSGTNGTRYEIEIPI